MLRLASPRLPIVLPSFLSALITLTAAAGCDRSPDMTKPTQSLGNATISGTIVSMGGATAPTSSGATVKDPASNVFTVVDANQSFTLTNVVSGQNVILQFTGAGLNTQVSVGVVNFADHVVLVFARNPDGTVQIDATGRRSADGTEIDGRISSISSVDRSFIVLGQTVKTDQSTQYFRSNGLASSFFELGVGFRVQVTSIPAESSAVLARVVRLDEVDTGSTTVTLTAVISDLSGTAVNFQFTMLGRLVNGGSLTTFEGGSFSNLANGKQIQLTGVNRIGFIQATTIRFQ